MSVVCKKISESEKRFESYRTSKLKNHKNFATFLKKKFNFTVKLSLGLKNQKTNFRLMHFFILKPKTTSFFSPTARLGAVPYFVKTGSTVKWGKKNRFSKLAKKIRLVIYQTLRLLSLMKNHTQKRKLEVICALRGQNWAS